MFIIPKVTYQWDNFNIINYHFVHYNDGQQNET